MLLYLFSVLCLSWGGALAQRVAGIGTWQLHIPYTQGRAVAEAGDRVYLAAEQALFYYDKAFNSVQPVTRLDGLSEQQLSTIGYDAGTGTLVVAYANGNIDLLQQHRLTNLPGLLRRTGYGDKSIHHIRVHNKTAYLSTAFGLVEVDLARQEIKDTYANLGPTGENITVLGSAIRNETLYLMSSREVRQANRLSSNLKDFRSWQPVNAPLPDNVQLTAIATFQENLYLGTAAHGLLVLQNGTWERVAATGAFSIKSITSSETGLAVATEKGVLLLDKQANATNLTDPLMPAPAMAVRDGQGGVWVADQHSGLVLLGAPGRATRVFAPDGPATGNSFRVQAGAGAVHVLSGGYDSNFQAYQRADGYYTYRDRAWRNTSPVLVQASQTVLRDVVDAVYNPVTQKLYLATFGQGLLVQQDGAADILYTSANSTLVSTRPGAEQVRLTDVAADAAGNVWMINRHQTLGAPGLHVLRPDGAWQGFAIPGIAENGRLERLAIDGNGYKWASVSQNANVRTGLVVFDETKQQVRLLRTGAGNGNLPSGAVHSITTDMQGDIWVGTGSGIAVYHGTGAVFGSQVYDARIPVIDGHPLLGGHQVHDIAVDGANRKWVATDNGLWLFSPTGDELLQHFTVRNSPLPNDSILSVAVEHKAGDVFVVTKAGVASYRAGATVTEGKPDCAQVYPNPVRPGYSGLIGVSGLPNNADVRITDINGTLVYQAKATGGTLAWDGRGYNGRRVRAGVYLVLAADAEARQTCITKIAVLE